MIWISICNLFLFSKNFQNGSFVFFKKWKEKNHVENKKKRCHNVSMFGNNFPKDLFELIIEEIKSCNLLFSWQRENKSNLAHQKLQKKEIKIKK